MFLTYHLFCDGTQRFQYLEKKTSILSLGLFGRYFYAFVRRWEDSEVGAILTACFSSNWWCEEIWPKKTIFLKNHILNLC